MIADNIVADSYLLAKLRRDIVDDIIADLFIKLHVWTLFFLMSILNMKIFQQNFYYSLNALLISLFHL